MLKKLSVSALALSTLILPAATFAHGLDLGVKANVKLAAQARQEERREERQDNGKHLGQLKKKQDMQVAMTGTLTAMSGSSLTLKLSNGSTYTVDASAAKMIRRFGGAMVLGDLQLNDQLYVKGTLNETTIKASMIQDLSLQARNGQFVGTVQSASGTTLIVKTNNRGIQTINTNASTTVMKSGQKVTLADVMVGATVKVDGVWNRVNDNLLAQKIHIVVRVEGVRLNGTVSSMSSTTLMMVGSDGKTYTVDTTKAKLSASGYYGSDFSKVHVGDHVQVWGKTESGSLKINANLLVDFSLSV